MRVVVTKTTSEDMMHESLEININEKTKFHVSHSEESPEDNTLYRNFADCHDIPRLLEMAYMAGKSGEEFELEYVTEGDDIY